jgi:glycerol-3-phosphate acyltransferase PlsX
MVASSTMTLGLLPGIRRAGIAATVQAGEKPVVLMDVGANIQPKPEHLFQYGIMATKFAGCAYGVENPVVGLLNVGAEEDKGNLLVQETRELFVDSGLRFHGHVEGDDIFLGDCDVIVCDGFVGNIVIKVAEGVAERILQLIFRGLESLEEKEGVSPLQRRALRALVSKVQHSDYGGAPLLGVDGVAIIGHGRSNAKAISNALKWAKNMANARVNEQIVEAVAAG